MKLDSIHKVIVSQWIRCKRHFNFRLVQLSLWWRISMNICASDTVRNTTSVIINGSLDFLGKRKFVKDFHHGKISVGKCRTNECRNLSPFLSNSFSHNHPSLDCFVNSLLFLFQGSRFHSKLRRSRLLGHVILIVPITGDWKDLTILATHSAAVVV